MDKYIDLALNPGAAVMNPNCPTALDMEVCGDSRYGRCKHTSGMTPTLQQTVWSMPLSDNRGGYDI